MRVLRDSRLAEAYCDRLFDAAADGRKRASTSLSTTHFGARRTGLGKPVASGQWAGLDEDPRLRMYIALIQVCQRCMRAVPPSPATFGCAAAAVAICTFPN